MTNAVKGIIDSIVALPIANNTSLSIKHDKIDILVQSYNPSAATTVTPSTGLTISLPSGIHGGGMVVQLVSVVYKGKLYQSLAA